MRHTLNLPAPAKLNLFLHVVGRRNDGYHLLQSVMLPLDLHDSIDVVVRDDLTLERQGDVIGELERDLCLRAARLLQQASGVAQGATITVQKRIPAGSGLGGGSSDAATTLIALNQLWKLHWPRERLQSLALQLGADVPFFLGQGPAFVEGVGEVLTALSLPPQWFVLVHPQVHVSTPEIFNDPGLTRDTKLTTISGFSAAHHEFLNVLSAESTASGVGTTSGGGCDASSDTTKSNAQQSFAKRSASLFGVNDLEAVAQRRVPAIDAVLKQLAPYGCARMSGSGSAVFLPVASHAVAVQIASALRQETSGWSVWVVKSESELPLAAWLDER